VKEQQVDRIKDMLDRLSELDEGQMADLESSILGEFESIEKQEPSAEVVATMTALADALDVVRTEQAARSSAAAELASQIAEQTSRVRGQTAAMDEEAPVEDAVPDEEEEEGETPEEDTPEEEDAERVVVGEFSETTDAAAATVDSPVEAAQAAVADDPAAAETADAAAAFEAGAEDAQTSATEAASADAQSAATANVHPTTQPEENPVAASAQTVVVQAPADAQPSLVRPPVTVTAGADIPGKTAGQAFSDLSEVSEAFIKRLHALRRVTGGDGEQHIVASIHADYPEDRTLFAGSAAENWEKIQKLTSRQALVAAANCYPLETKYDLFGVGVADRPVRDALAVFNADRGGLRYYAAPTLSTIPSDGTGPVGFWKQDGSVTSVAGASLSSAKPCFTVTCGNELEVLLEAVSTCLTFDNLVSRANPEIIARHNELALIFHARVTEIDTLKRIKTGGTAITGVDYKVGATREFFAQLDGIAAAYRYKYRMGTRTPLRAIIPEFFLDQVRADIAMQMPGDTLETLAIADSLVANAFRVRNINVTWSLDSVSNPPASNGAFAGTMEWDLFAEGTWLYLDGGTLDIGVIRDSSLVAANDYKVFAEEFMGVAKIGDESLHVTSTILTSGAAAALEDNFS
jgi:hypothetical protein